MPMQREGGSMNAIKKGRSPAKGNSHIGNRQLRRLRKYSEKRHRLQSETALRKKIIAAKDGQNLGIVARNRLTPAHDALTAIYAGLLYRHILSGSTLFKEAFHRANAGRRV